jgi:cysteine-rich repeat protein
MGDAGAGAGAMVPDPPLPDTCGDAIVGSSEECEPGVNFGASCALVGFETGVLRCGADCAFDKADCRGTERCLDGRDNDGDGTADCFDSDCMDACAASCEAPDVVADGASITASTEGRASVLTSSCSGAAAPELVLQVTAETTGKLDVIVSARGLTTLSLRTTCEDDSSELECSIVDGQGGLSVDVTSGEVLFVVVEGYDAAATGNLTLEVTSRPANQCGDSFVDDAEECDDGAGEGEDGCGPTCQVEVTETEPNDSFDEVEAYADPTYALIDPEGETDYFSFVVDDGPKQVTIDVLNVGSGFCNNLEMDPYLELFDEDMELLAENDDGGEGYCPRLVAQALTDGQYVIAVSESESATSATRSTFGYELSVTTD